MIQRAHQQAILEDLQFFPVVTILGPRQVGKTTLARQLQLPSGKPVHYLDLEWEEDRRKLSDPGTYLRYHADKCVVIDEVQLMPSLFPLLRSLVDQQREPARFILLGSASPQLHADTAESLAGRIAYHELSPLSLLEVPAADGKTHWLRGGFPPAFLAPTDRFAANWLIQFYTTYVERDLGMLLGKEINSTSMLRLLRMLGHYHGKSLNVQELSNAIGMARATINKYLDLLEHAFLIRRLEPFFANLGKRLTKSPKFYFRDSGMFHALSRIHDWESLYGSPAIGASWEGYVIEQIYRVAGRQLEYTFYRTQHGAEVDLLLITPRSERICIEIKSSAAPQITRGFYESIEDLRPSAAFVITPGGEKYPTAKGVTVISLREFLETELPGLSFSAASTFR